MQQQASDGGVRHMRGMGAWACRCKLLHGLQLHVWASGPHERIASVYAAPQLPHSLCRKPWHGSPCVGFGSARPATCQAGRATENPLDALACRLASPGTQTSIAMMTACSPPAAGRWPPWCFAAWCCWQQLPCAMPGRRLRAPGKRAHKCCCCSCLSFYLILHVGEASWRACLACHGLPCPPSCGPPRSNAAVLAVPRWMLSTHTHTHHHHHPSTCCQLVATTSTTDQRHHHAVHGWCPRNAPLAWLAQCCAAGPAGR